jgi:hypothetical protein
MYAVYPVVSKQRLFVETKGIFAYSNRTFAVVIQNDNGVPYEYDSILAHDGDEFWNNAV